MEEDLIADILARHMASFLTLVKHGFFEMKSGSITVHFDHNGRMRKFDHHTVTIED